MAKGQRTERVGREELQRGASRLYERYYSDVGEFRNSLLHNPEVMFQSFAFQKSLIDCLRKLDLDPPTAKVLDVGCGTGGSLPQMIELGFDPANFTGIDLLEDRIAVARRKYPGVRFIAGDARELPCEDDALDLVLESTMFINVTDNDVAKAVATEMVRVVRPSGYIVVIDWRYAKPGKEGYLAVTRKRIGYLFDVGTQTDVYCAARGALVPPLGRMLSKRLPSLYFLVAALVPFLVGQKTTVLRKRRPSRAS
jgi:ubiquinone/menaquinone biosynthesis C-methylase UbiE